MLNTTNGLRLGIILQMKAMKRYVMQVEGLKEGLDAQR